MKRDSRAACLLTHLLLSGLSPGDDYACNDTISSEIGGHCTAKLFGSKPWSQMGVRLQYEQAEALLNSNDSITGLMYK